MSHRPRRGRGRRALSPLPRIEAVAVAPPPADGAHRLTLGFAPVTIEAAKGEGKRPTFDIVGYTGAPFRQWWSPDPIIVDLAGLKPTSQQIPALRNHDVDRVVGQTDAITVGDDLRLAGTITGENDDTAEITTHSKNGFRWQASIGADIVRSERLESGKTTTVNGREVTGPITIVRESSLYEISFVALGADGQTSASVAASITPGTHQGSIRMNFEQWLQAKGFDPAALSDGQKTVLRLAYDAEHPAAPPPATPPVQAHQPPPAQPPATPSPAPAPTQTLDQIFAEHRAEQERVAEITRITADAVRERPMLADDFERMARVAIEARHGVAEYELAVLRASRNVPAGGFAIHAGDRRTAGPAVVEAAICLSGGLDGVEKRFDERTLNAASDRFPGGLGLQDILRLAARENGHAGHISAGDIRTLLGAAFGRDIRASSGFSTLSLPGIFANVANKFLIAGFNGVEGAWREIAARRSAPDFRAINSYSLTGGFMYEKVGPGGELKHATLGEESYTNQVETYGRMFAVTRQDLINDDLGALTQIPTKLGRGAALSLNDKFWTVFLGGVGSFWTGGRNNLETGGGTALASAGLKTLTTTFNQQTDPDGYPLGVMPRILLVPTELEIAAAELMTSAMINTGGSSTTDQVPSANVWRSKYRTVSSTYLSNANYTGNSPTAWYLLADPNDLPTIEVAFLNGRERPIVENADADFNTLGVQFRGYFDYGIALQEYRGSVRAAGA